MSIVWRALNITKWKPYLCLNIVQLRNCGKKTKSCDVYGTYMCTCMSLSIDKMLLLYILVHSCTYREVILFFLSVEYLCWVRLMRRLCRYWKTLHVCHVSPWCFTRDQRIQGRHLKYSVINFFILYIVFNGLYTVSARMCCHNYMYTVCHIFMSKSAACAWILCLTPCWLFLVANQIRK